MQLHPFSPSVGLEKWYLQTHHLAVGINMNINMDLRTYERTISNKLLMCYSFFSILILHREEH